jgi:hypothetical protein
MKTIKIVLVLTAFIGLLFTGCSEKSSPVASSTDQAVNSSSGSMSLGKMTVTSFTGREDIIDFVDGIYVGTKGNRVVGKGGQFKSIWTSSMPLLNNAEMEFTLHASFNTSGEGPLQGKFTMSLGGGTLEGTLEGKMFAVNEDEMQGNFKYVGHGKGGTIDGMKLVCTETYHESKSYAFLPYGDLTGFIK